MALRPGWLADILGYFGIKTPAGVTVAQRSLIQFFGNGVAVTDNPSTGCTDVHVNDTSVDSANATGALTLDLSLTTRRFRRTLTGNITSIAVTAPPEPGNWIIDFVQGAGPYTLPVAGGSWPGSSLFIEDTPPVLSTTNASHNLVALYYDGTSYFWSAACGPYL